jgi:paraquat-inducible protein B
VKLRGVRVGRVVGLNIRYDQQNNQSVVAVLCEFSKDVIIDNRGLPVNVSDRAELLRMVERGLRARLEVQSLATGMLFVGLDFLDPKENPADPKLTDARYVVVPSVPSAISEFQASVTEILTNLKKIDFAGISRGLTALMADTRKQLDGVDIKGLADQWKKTGAQFEALASGPEVKQIFTNLNAAIGDLRATVAKLDSQIEPTGQQLAATLEEAKKTLQTFNQTADAARTFIQQHEGFGANVTGTLEHLNEAAESVRRLADFLERNPNALITGRKRP